MTLVELIYQYAVGGLFFFGTLILCLRAEKGVPRSPADRRTVAILLLGFVGYLTVHATWIYLAGR